MMTTILVSLILVSWAAVLLTDAQTNFFGESAKSLEAITIPVADQPTARNFRRGR